MATRLITYCLLFLLPLLREAGNTKIFAGAVMGNVNPADAALRAWLFSPTDTLTAQVENSGHFQISQVKPGNYRLLIEARPPYRNYLKESLHVTEGPPTDAGTIEMQK